MLERTGGRASAFCARATIRRWENCEANRREGEEYLRVVLEESGATRVVGEDLGTVPDYVRPKPALVRHRRLQDSAVGKRTGRTVARSRAATTSGSRSPPMRRTITNRFARSGKTAFENKTDALRAGPRTTWRRSRSSPGSPRLTSRRIIVREFYPAIFEALFRSESWIAIVMITDLLGRKDRFNVPGTASELELDAAPAHHRRQLGRGHALQRQLAPRARPRSQQTGAQPRRCG